MNDCTFCQIIAGDAVATIVTEWNDALAIRPLGPVTSGHVLVIPRTHVPDLATDPAVTGATFARAAHLAAMYAGPCNLITSRGPEATQTVMHLHVHIVPRRAGDGLLLPWSNGRRHP